MKRHHAAVAVAAALAAGLLVPLAGSAAAPGDAVCSQDTHVFTGTARDLTVPEGGFCEISGATITGDLIQLDFAGAVISDTSVGGNVIFGGFAGADIFRSSIGHDVVARGEDSGAGVTDTTIGHDFLALGTESGAGFTRSSIGHDFVGQGDRSGADVLETTIGHDMKLLGEAGGTHLESVTIGHDLFASKPQTVQTGHNAPDTPGGPVSIKHDLVIEGSPDFPFVFDGLCNLTVGRDLRITDRSVTLGTGLGGNCAANGEQADTIGRDLIVTGNSALSGFFGPSSINVVDNHVGRDLVFTDNGAVPGGSLEVSGNVVGRDATCAGNDPAVSVPTPNVAGRSNTCG